MTRARALKTIIRARAAKTGERYTTARRHVLSQLPGTQHSQSRESSIDRETAAEPKAKTAAPSKGSVSDAKSLEKTGHGLEHWFGVLDRFGAVAKGHTAAAKHLYADHAVNGWYAQGITVAYERARGVRVLNQRGDGEYEVSASKVMTGDTKTVVKAITDPRQRQRWAPGADPALMKALSSALKAKTSKGFVIRPDGLGRYRYKWDGTTVQFYVTPKPAGKSSVVASNLNLATPAMVDDRRAKWRTALGALATFLSAKD